MVHSSGATGVGPLRAAPTTEAAITNQWRCDACPAPSCATSPVPLPRLSTMGCSPLPTLYSPPCVARRTKGADSAPSKGYYFAKRRAMLT